MWVFTTRGFFSAVEHRKHPDQVLVRARNEEDIRNLEDLLPESKPWRLKRSDYEWRLQCSKDEWAEALKVLVSEIDYDNFKSAVTKKQGHKRASIYMGVWSKLLSLEPGRRAGGWSSFGKSDKSDDSFTATAPTLPLAVAEPEDDDPLDLPDEIFNVDYTGEQCPECFADTQEDSRGVYCPECNWSEEVSS